MSDKWNAIFTDMDGTLLNSSHEISPITQKAIHHCTEQGMTFVLSSSRSAAGMEPIARKYNLNCSIIAFGGALVLDESRNTIYENGMDYSTASSVIAFLENNHPEVTWNIFTSDQWIVKEKNHPRIKREESIVETEATEGTMESINGDRIIDKILCMCPVETIDHIEKLLQAEFPGLSIVKSADIHIEVNQAGVNKGTAVEVLCRHKNIPIETTLGFGDNFNDYVMLKTVGQGYVMENAPENMKKDFSNITDTNDNDGLYQVLKKLHIVE